MDSNIKAAFKRVHHRIKKVEGDVEEHEKILRGNSRSIGLRADVKILKDYMKEIRGIFRVVALMFVAEIVAAGIWAISQMNK